MKTNLTELVFILDRSGSMAGLEGDTIGGYNALLKKQKEEPGEAIVTTVLFDDNYELLHDRINVKGIRPITEKEYFVCGCTALLDAIGKTINKIGNVQRNTVEEERADKVMFVITTDGMENASNEFNYEKIKKMVEWQKKKYGWEFIFIGANIDAIATAAKFGISSDRAANYNADGEGTRLNYEAVNNVVCELRASRPITDSWKAEIEEDFTRRGKKSSR
ncbi:vWA domain-containing protein [Clostridium sp.]|uniref:vWA domain-containing protein n=1 Tax=Clostridium sp. TaxID=1506 RepID=UPI003D6C75A1